MTRSVKEWIGASDDSRAPDRVCLRIFESNDGRCHCCNRKIAAGELWDLDHVTALINGGENRESNMRPILRAHHKVKTRADVATKSRSYKRRASHAGIKRKRQGFRGWRNFKGEPIFAKRNAT